MNILVAEDEQDIRELINLHLVKEGYRVFEANDGIMALEIFKREKIDLALLDVMMPHMDGFNVLKNIRKVSNIPVLFLTAMSESSDKILGLGLGADDYIVKPFNPIELIARIQAHLRRSYNYSNQDSKKDLILGELQLNKESCSLFKNNEEIYLNPKEFKLIQLMMDNPGKVYTKKQLYEAIWEDVYYGDDNTIMVHISHIRDKIEDNPKCPKYLKTVRGIGYKFEKVCL